MLIILLASSCSKLLDFLCYSVKPLYFLGFGRDVLINVCNLLLISLIAPHRISL